MIWTKYDQYTTGELLAIDVETLSPEDLKHLAKELQKRMYRGY